ncbi:MAG: DUF3187 family protein [Gammaproteobacteria bacterium]
MPRLFNTFCLTLAACVCAGPALAGDFVPGGNAGTLARAFALPALGDATVLGRGRVETRWTLDAANEYVVEGNCAIECIRFDGETTRLRYAYRLGLGNDMEFGFELPFYDRGGGFLDGWIEDWHQAFDLPNGERELDAQDQYRFRYEQANVALLDETRGGSGLGAARLMLGQRWGRSGVLRAMAMLPLGSGNELENGNTGYAIWVERALDIPEGGGGYIAAGVSYNERGDFLPQMQNRMVAFGGIGMRFPLTQSVWLSMQVQAHGRLYDGSSLTPLERPGVPLTLGLQFRTGSDSAFEIGFQEDPSVNGSPDFVLYVSYRSES